MDKVQKPSINECSNYLLLTVITVKLIYDDILELARKDWGKSEMQTDTASA
jgi:hypothetical protein